MTGQDEQRGPRSRKSTSSSRLSIGAEDSWRSWRDLPTGATDDADDADDVDPSEQGPSGPEMPSFGGSMMVVVAPAVEPTPAQPSSATAPSDTATGRPAGAGKNGGGRATANQAGTDPSSDTDQDRSAAVVAHTTPPADQPGNPGEPILPILQSRPARNRRGAARNSGTPTGGIARLLDNRGRRLVAGGLDT